MALVDYSSDSASDSDAGPPPAKTRRLQSPERTPAASDLPPLPEAFHDLYASTVRQSIVDDPSLHHGRKRTFPHVVGNWPSHIYIEWHPIAREHAILSDLLTVVRRQLRLGPPESDHKLHSFLTSELNAPLPLHISLSRPLALTTATKDSFLDRLRSSLRSFSPSAFPPTSRRPVTGTGPSPSCSFTVSPTDLVFHRSPDSDRTFLVLRVASSMAATTRRSRDPDADSGSNPHLRNLLRRCNALASSYGHPTLYVPPSSPSPSPSKHDSNSSPSSPSADADDDSRADDAFHISIAWTFAPPPADEESRLRTHRLLTEPPFDEIRTWRIPVSAVKAKIGNVITSIPLASGTLGRW